ITMDDAVTHKGSRNNLLGPNPDPKAIEFYSNEKQVTKDTPPTFIFHTSADTAVLPENATRFYLACKKAGVPVELHMYEKGRHGVGLGRDPKWTGGETSGGAWPDRLARPVKAPGGPTAKKETPVRGRRAEGPRRTHSEEVAAVRGPTMLLLRGRNRPVDALAFSPDGSRLAVAGGCVQPVEYWDLTTGRLAFTGPSLTYNPLTDNLRF